MAKGFAAGLFHGALTCAAALAALSLILPQPARRDQTSTPEAITPAPPPAPVVKVDPPAIPDSSPPPAAPPPAAPVPAPSQSPVVEDMTPPEGSEFARGTDIAPVSPAPMAAVAPRSVEAPVAPAPQAESLPAPADPALPPEARGEVPEVSGMSAPAPDPIALPDTPPDSPAAMQSASRAAPQGLAAPADEPVFALPSEPQPDPQPASAPAPEQGLNLSTPPDFGALRLNGTNE